VDAKQGLLGRSIHSGGTNWLQQKVTLEKVNGLCLKLEDADEFKHCTSTLKHYRKSYRVMLQALL
jgi:hypothetical protein